MSRVSALYSEPATPKDIRIDQEVSRRCRFASPASRSKLLPGSTRSTSRGDNNSCGLCSKMSASEAGKWNSAYAFLSTPTHPAQRLTKPSGQEPGHPEVHGPLRRQCQAMTVCVPLVKARKKVPSVDGAITRCPSTSAVAPARSMSAWSMWLAPATMAWTSVRIFLPGRNPPTRPGQLDRGVTQLLESEPLGQGRNEHEAGVGHQIRLVEGHRDAVDTHRDTGLTESASFVGENYGVSNRNSPSNGGIFPGYALVRSRGYAVDRSLVRWAMRKFKRLRRKPKQAWERLIAARQRTPQLFAHWFLLPVTPSRPVRAG